MVLPTPKETKDSFLKSEHNKWEYWKQFPYTEYLSVMAQDAVKCECGTYTGIGVQRSVGVNKNLHGNEISYTFAL